MSAFKNNLKAARVRAGLSQQDVANKLKISRENFNKIENCKSPAGSVMLERIASIQELGITIDQLKGWKALDELGFKAINEAYKTAQELESKETL